MTAEQFNARYPVGSAFLLAPSGTSTETRTKAFNSGKRTLVYVVGISNAIDVRRLEDLS